MNSSSYINLWKGEFYKQFILLKRYWLNTATRIVGVYMIFLVMFFGGKSIGGARFNDSLDGLIMGFFLWTMCLAAFMGLVWAIRNESQWGTLEQKFMSPFGFGQVMVANLAFKTLLSFIWGACILLLMMGTTGRWISLNVLAIGPILFFTLFSVFAIGLVLGGLALLYKRVENIFSIFQFLMVGLIAAPSFIDHAAVKLLPLSHGSSLLNVVLTNELHLWELNPLELFLFLGKNVLFLYLGYQLFQWFVKRARQKGVMGHY